ncbi:dihydrolipoyl dehydrogenase [Nocardioides marmorisolisilvae]|uniref:Dihydrolipoyl dehydrogenase n=1 Tax=Nocardioides marmorisolisilvae TaxID=1542737 RepID=A0A3N0DTT7_9ACTN|nr:dihydrolipoyl dehydrogenase [Nocardioides marmorisolisilvae]RNL79037.1 dihydrolipoyl dehydrogenase [Nocardioides marmorisolisilvae]
MADANHFDVVILGAGSGGYACALRAAQLGLSVALVEKGNLGGTCLHVGCIPTKALLHAAEVADAARDAEQFGVRATLDGIDMAGVNAYKDGVVQRLFKGLTGLIKGRGITVVEGSGRLTAPNTVTVDGPEGSAAYVGTNVVLASGSYSRTLPGLEIDGERVITSEHALTLDRVPASVVVLGGGVIGCEFASVWSSFGAEVTIVEALPRLMAAEDADSSKQLERAFRKRKIKALTGTPFQKVELLDTGVRVHVEGADPIEAELLLVAVGRGPTTDDLGYAEAGVAMDRGFVLADETCRTSVPNVFAVGDIVPGLQLAHRGFAQGILVAEEIAGLNPKPIDEAGIPRVTYCDPELASVGLTEAQARELHGDAVETLTYDLGGNGKSQILKTQGSVKLVRRADGPVIGIHLVGARVGELIGEAQLIFNWEAYPDDVAPLVHAHPTQNEALGEAHLALAGKPLHAHS